MKRIFSIIVVSLLLISKGVFAQSPVDIRINEVLPYNISGVTDENGERCGWIELFNTAYGMVDVAGFYLTDNKDNPTKYMIPKGNNATIIPLRKYLVLYADGQPNKGLFHTNFTLNGVTHLYLYDSDGKTLLDEIEIPANMPEDKSFGRVKDGEGVHVPVGWSKRSLRKNSIDSKVGADGGLAILEHPTPALTNTTKAVQSKSEIMKDMDPYGVILALTAMSVVFLCLVILYTVFKSIGKRALRKEAEKREAVKESKVVKIPSVANIKTADGAINEEVIAAIAIACHLYSNGIDSSVHDMESGVLTFNRDILNNSAWGSKTLTLKEEPIIK